MNAQRLFALLLACALPLAGCGGGSDTKDYVQVGIAYHGLLRDPNQACTYVAANAATYGKRFDECGTHHVNRMANEIDRLRAECDAIFVDPYDLLKCDEDRGVPELATQLEALSAVMEITTGSGGCAVVGCSCQTFAAQYQPLVDLFNATLPLGLTWQQTMDASLDDMKVEYAC